MTSYATQPAPAELGSLLCFLASHEAAAITGQAFSIDGGTPAGITRSVHMNRNT